MATGQIYNVQLFRKKAPKNPNWRAERDAKRIGKIVHGIYRGRCLNCGCSEYAEDRNGEKLTNLIGTNCKNWDVTKASECGHLPEEHSFLGKSSQKCTHTGCFCSTFHSSSDSELCIGCGHDFSLHNGPSASWQVKTTDIQFAEKKPIAKGTMGEIFIGYLWGKKFAVKTIVNKVPSDIDLELFHSEVQLMSELRHPNVLGLVAACIEPPKLCIVMEFASRGSLLDLLHEQKVPIPNKQAIALEIAQGMNYLHSNHNIFHRDLKSSNCLVFEDWTVKISDYGISRTAPTKESAVLGRGKQYGTPLWMAPEIIRKDLYTKAADVYSYGVILYELESGQLPFYEEDLDGEQVMKAVLAGERPKIPVHCNDIIKKLIHACWNHNPEERPTFEQIIKELDPPQSTLFSFADLEQEKIIKPTNSQPVKKVDNTTKRLSPLTIVNTVMVALLLQNSDGSFDLEAVAPKLALTVDQVLEKMSDSVVSGTLLVLAFMKYVEKVKKSQKEVILQLLKSQGKEEWESRALNYLKNNQIEDVSSYLPNLSSLFTF